MTPGVGRAAGARGRARGSGGIIGRFGVQQCPDENVRGSFAGI
jgi:hypothetical protein